jgi:TonB family protein
MNYREENNYPKAFLATAIIMVVLLALCYIVIIHFVPQDDGTGGILVNYGTTDKGMGKDITSTDEPSVSPKANHTQPVKVTPVQPTEQKTQVEKSNEKVVTQNTEDAPEVAANAKKPTKNVAATPVKPVHQEVVNQNALYKGPSKTGTGAGDGTTTTPGNQGSRNGSTLSDNYGPGGSGTGLNMPYWSFVSQPDPQNPHRIPGVVVIDFVVDQTGTVISASENKSKTHADLSLVQSCENAIKNTKFTSSTPASGTQKGEYTFRFKVD